MSIVALQIYKQYEALRKLKSSKLQLMRQVNEFFNPDDDLLRGNRKISTPTYDGLLSGELLDTTGTDLIDEYVAFVLGLQYITDKRWFSAKIKGEPSASDANKIMSKRADKLHKELAGSSYYSVLNSLEKDVILHGHGSMVIEADEENFVKCYTQETDDLVIAQDLYGNVHALAWVDFYPAFQVMQMFPNAVIKDKSLLGEHFEKTLTILTFYQKLGPMDTEAPEGAKWKIDYIAYPAQKNNPVATSGDFIDLDETKYENEQTIFATRDVYNRKSAYGLGMGRRALPKSRITNKLMFNLLKFAGLLANPPRVQHPAITAETGLTGELKEGQVFTTSAEQLEGTDVTKALVLLQTTGDLSHLLQLYQLQIQQLTNLLPTASSIYKVARQSIQEIQQRLDEQNKRLQPLRETFLREGPAKHLKLLYEIADKQGKFNHEEFKLPDNAEAEFKIDISMLQSFRQDKALRAAQALGVSSNYLSLSPASVAKLNADRMIDTAFDGYQVADLLESRAVVQQKREAERRQLEQQQQNQERSVDASTDASNAEVIKTILEGKNV